jgi:hypothetical protein
MGGRESARMKKYDAPDLAIRLSLAVASALQQRERRPLFRF